MDKLICSNCKFWHYDRFTEEYLGMGVGRCSADGSARFCEHQCALCIPIEEDDNE